MKRLIAGWAVAVSMLASLLVAAPPSSTLPQGLDAYRPVPEGNPLSAGKVALGRRLFRDKRLSSDGSVSCASCHDAAKAFTDGRTVPRGVGVAVGQRNTPTLLNRAWGASFFWDGRSSTLEQQVLEPVFNAQELGSSPERLMAVVEAHHRADFRRVFPGEALTTELVARALASYVRTIVGGRSAFDRKEMKAGARRGAELFFGRAGCIGCHTGPLFTDEEFHNTGVAWRLGGLLDEGRFRVTGVEADRGAFKTPTLREVGRTAPYMHDGSLETLEDVVAYYDRGGERNAWLDSRVRPLGLADGEKADLVAFLRSLTGEIREGW
jgi:cytochrome c peroxidase